MADQVLTGNNTRIWSQSKTKEWVLYDVENELDNAYQVRNDDGQLVRTGNVIKAVNVMFLVDSCTKENFPPFPCFTRSASF